MTDRPIYIDATFFLGMHDRDDLRRAQSMWYFTRDLSAQPRINFEQIGICDAVVWEQRREVQDQYYPFMDRLHTDMAVQRMGYSFAEIQFAIAHPELKQLAPSQVLLVGQVLYSQGILATHDPVLSRLGCLQGHLWAAPDLQAPPNFSGELHALYEASRAFVYSGELPSVWSNM